jgi:hypothetical protein
VLALVPASRLRRRRRLRGPRGEGVASSPPVTDRPDLATVAPVAGDGDTAPVPDGPERPTLTVPFRSDGPAPPVWVILMAAAGAGIVAGAVSVLWVGLAVGVATAVVLWVPRLRVVLGLAAIAGIVAAGAYVTIHQHADHVPSGGDWTLSFGTAGTLAWAGVVFLGADGLVELILRRWDRPVRIGPGAPVMAVAVPPPTIRRYQQRVRDRSVPGQRGRGQRGSGGRGSGGRGSGGADRPTSRRLRGMGQ